MTAAFLLQKIVSGNGEDDEVIPSNKEISNMLRIDSNEVVAWFGAHGKTWTSVHALYLAAEVGGEVWERKAPRFQHNLDERIEASEKRKRNMKVKSEKEEHEGLRKKQRTDEKNDFLNLCREASDDRDDETVATFLSTKSVDDLKRMLSEHNEQTAKTTSLYIHFINVKTLENAQSKSDEDFECPINKSCMVDPVFASDGHTYERSAIVQWLKEHATSPLTGLQLPNKTLTANHVLKSMIQSRVFLHH